MPDTLTIKASGAQFTPHPEGQFVAVCVDVIDLGENVEQFQGQPAKLAHKCALVFRTGERNEATGEYIDIGREFTASMNEKANLRKFLEQWRGKPYTNEQVERDGVPVDKLYGQPALLTVSHKQSNQGRTYANITACVGVPKQMRGALPDAAGYARAEYWTEKKGKYAEAARTFRGQQAPPPSDEDFGGFPDEDDSLPF